MAEEIVNKHILEISIREHTHTKMLLEYVKNGEKNDFVMFKVGPNNGNATFCQRDIE